MRTRKIPKYLDALTDNVIVDVHVNYWTRRPL